MNVGCPFLKVRDVPYPPIPDKMQVHVQVEACGINFADIYTRQGLVRDKTPPFVMGLECAGVISQCGSQVTELKVIE